MLPALPMLLCLHPAPQGIHDVNLVSHTMVDDKLPVAWSRSLCMPGKPPSGLVGGRRRSEFGSFNLAPKPWVNSIWSTAGFITMEHAQHAVRHERIRQVAVSKQGFRAFHTHLVELNLMRHSVCTDKDHRRSQRPENRRAQRRDEHEKNGDATKPRLLLHPGQHAPADRDGHQ